MVERGRGYVPPCRQGRRRRDRPDPGRLEYSPVLKVTQQVEATRLEQRTDFDKLVPDIETKAAISRGTRESAGRTLVELFGLARELNVEAEGIEIGPSPIDEQLAATTCALPVEDLQPDGAGPTTASSVRASTPSVSGFPLPSRTCWTSGTSVPRVHRRGQAEAAREWDCLLKDSAPGLRPAVGHPGRLPTRSRRANEDGHRLRSETETVLITAPPAQLRTGERAPGRPGPPHRAQAGSGHR